VIRAACASWGSAAVSRWPIRQKRPHRTAEAAPTLSACCLERATIVRFHPNRTTDGRANLVDMPVITGIMPPSEHIQHGSGRVCGNLCAYEAGESSVCRVTAVGRLAETAVGGPQRAGDMYQNPAARLWLIEDVGMDKPTLLRTGSQVRQRWLRS
jgi:hypothetical protein